MPTPEDRTLLTADLYSAGFLECVFHCPTCGLGGTSFSRPAVLAGKRCGGCGDPVALSVLGRFSRGG